MELVSLEYMRCDKAHMQMSSHSVRGFICVTTKTAIYTLFWFLAASNSG